MENDEEEQEEEEGKKRSFCYRYLKWNRGKKIEGRKAGKKRRTGRRSEWGGEIALANISFCRQQIHSAGQFKSERNGRPALLLNG